MIRQSSPDRILCCSRCFFILNGDFLVINFFIIESFNRCAEGLRQESISGSMVDNVVARDESAAVENISIDPSFDIIPDRIFG